MSASLLCLQHWHYLYHSLGLLLAQSLDVRLLVLMLALSGRKQRHIARKTTREKLLECMLEKRKRWGNGAPGHFWYGKFETKAKRLPR